MESMTTACTLFDLFTYRKIQGTPVGRSMIDDFIDVQRRANRLSHYIDENARMSARFKLLVNEAAKIDMEKLMDWNQEVVPVNGRPDDTQIRQLSVYQLNPQVDNHMQWLLDIIKRESGQNNSARGGLAAASRRPVQSNPYRKPAQRFPECGRLTISRFSRA